jgi:hypothetical protein
MSQYFKKAKAENDPVQKDHFAELACGEDSTYIQQIIIMYSINQNHEKVIKYCNLAIEKGLDIEKNITRKLKAYIGLKNNEMVYETYKTYKPYKPCKNKHKMMIFNLFHYYKQNNNDEKMLEILNDGVQMNDIHSINHLAQYYLKHNNNKLAKQYFEMNINNNNDSWISHFNMAMFYAITEHNYDDAIKHFEIALKYHTSIIHYYVNFLNRIIKDHNKAEKILLEYIEQVQPHPQPQPQPQPQSTFNKINIMCTLAHHYSIMKNNSLAFAYYDKAYELLIEKISNNNFLSKIYSNENILKILNQYYLKKQKIPINQSQYIGFPIGLWFRNEKKSKKNYEELSKNEMFKKAYDLFDKNGKNWFDNFNTMKILIFEYYTFNNISGQISKNVKYNNYKIGIWLHDQILNLRNSDDFIYKQLESNEEIKKIMDNKLTIITNKIKNTDDMCMDCINNGNTDCSHLYNDQFDEFCNEIICL